MNFRWCFLNATTSLAPRASPHFARNNGIVKIVYDRKTAQQNVLRSIKWASGTTSENGFFLWFLLERIHLINIIGRKIILFPSWMSDKREKQWKLTLGRSFVGFSERLFLSSEASEMKIVLMMTFEQEGDGRRRWFKCVTTRKSQRKEIKLEIFRTRSNLLKILTNLRKRGERDENFKFCL